jgi:hypothetical protein
VVLVIVNYHTSTLFLEESTQCPVTIFPNLTV